MQFHKIQQISEAHCGPAVLVMLLEAVGVQTTQEDIARAAGVEYSIDEHGMRLDQLAIACHKIAPDAQFWYKYDSSLDDIRYILQRGYGIGVEWQGLFYDTEEEEEEDGDYGHYSIISHIDEDRQVLILVDPYKDFVNQDRIFPIKSFLRRWWDTNEVKDPLSHRKRIAEDRRLLFFVTPKTEEFPPELRLSKHGQVSF
jgi:hypothetical protein